MRSNGADSFSASQLRSGLRTQAITLSKIGHPLRRPQSRSQRAPNRTGTVAHDHCAGPLHTTFAHDLCASSISHIAFVHLWLDHLHGRFQCSTRGGVRCCTRGGIQSCTREGVQCCTRGGQNGGSDPPVCALPLRLRTPGWLCASRGSGASLPTGGGRSRHNDPCGKARIAEG